MLATVVLARTIAEENNRPLAVMADLQGPRLRIGSFKTGNEHSVGVDWLQLNEQITVELLASP